jgi:hypothetical protein
MGNLIGRARSSPIISPIPKPTIPVSEPTLPIDVPSQLPNQEIECTPQKDRDISRVFVVGGGPSLKGFDFFCLSNVNTIVVNNAVFDVPNPKYFITVDYTFIRKVGRDKLKAAPSSKFFVVDRSYESIRKINGKYVDTRFGLVYEDLDIFDHIVESYRQDEFGYRFDDFRTGLNSGYCALQLAIILGYKNIYLLGFDLNVSGAKTHFHGGYGESPEIFLPKLNTYLDKFREGLIYLTRETNRAVFSCSVTSRLNDLIPYKPVQEALDEYKGCST